MDPSSRRTKHCQATCGVGATTGGRGPELLGAEDGGFRVGAPALAGPVSNNLGFTRKFLGWEKTSTLSLDHIILFLHEKTTCDN